MATTSLASSFPTSATNGTDTAAECGASLDWFQTNVEYRIYMGKLGICFIGLLLNLLTFGVFTRSHHFKGAPYVFMAALAFSDMATLVFKLPECFVMAYRGERYKNHVIREARKMAYFIYTNALSSLGNISENISVWLIVCLALERYIAMKHFGISKTKCNSFNAAIILALLCLASIIQNLFFFFGTRAKFVREGNSTYVKGIINPFYKTNWYTIFSWFRAIMAQFIPLIFLTVANVKLMLTLHHQRQRLARYGKNSNQKRSNREDSTTVTATGNNPEYPLTPMKRNSCGSRRQMAQRRLTIMLVLIICLVLFGQIPQAFSFHHLFTILFRECNRCKLLDQCSFYRVYKVIANLLNLINHGCNFFIYFSLNKHFRQHILRLCYRFQRRPNSATVCTTNGNGQSCAVRENRHMSDDPIIIRNQEQPNRRLSSGLAFIDDSEDAGSKPPTLRSSSKMLRISSSQEMKNLILLDQFPESV